MAEMCIRCKEIDEDRRTMWMACFYEMDELGLPFDQKHLELAYTDTKQQFYTMRVCKSCRADWMNAIKKWFHDIVPRESCGSGIYVMQAGVPIEITIEEWNKLRDQKAAEQTAAE